MKLLPEVQHRGLLDKASWMLAACLALCAHSAAGFSQTGPKLDRTKKSPADAKPKAIQHAHRYHPDGDKMKADGLPAVWYGPTKITSHDMIQDKIFDEQKCAFLQFGSNRSARTRRMDPAFDKLGRYMYRSEEVVIGRVDCRESPKLCKEYKVTRYPTLRYFKMGAEHASDSMRYHGNHEYNNMKHFVMRELGGTPQNCPLNPEHTDETGAKCGHNDVLFMKFHLNKTFPRILSLIRAIKIRERLQLDKLVFPMRMAKVKMEHESDMKLAKPEDKEKLVKDYELKKKKLEHDYVEDRIRRCRFIRTVTHVSYFNRMVTKAYKEEGVGAGLPKPTGDWLKWLKYQDKLGGGMKVFTQHDNGTVEQTYGDRPEDIHISDEEATFEHLEGYEEFLETPKV